MPNTFNVVSTVCVPVPCFTPRRFTNVRSAIAPRPAKNSAPLPRPTAWQKYVANTLAIEAMTVGLMTQRLAQPKMKARRSPKLSRMKT